MFRQGFCDELRQHVYDKFDAGNSDVLAAIMDNIICGFAVVEYIEKPQSPSNNSRKFYHVEEFGEFSNKNNPLDCLEKGYNTREKF